jgi:hypothetical protein
MDSPQGAFNTWCRSHGQPVLVRDSRQKAELMSPYLVSHETEVYLFPDGSRCDKATYIDVPPNRIARLQLERIYLAQKLSDADAQLAEQCKAADDIAAFSKIGNPLLPEAEVQRLEQFDTENPAIAARLLEIEVALAPVAEATAAPVRLREELKAQDQLAQQALRGRLERLRVNRGLRGI